MSKAGDALQSFLATWAGATKSRQTESDFAQWGYPGLGFAPLTELFSRWKIIIESLDKRGSWTSPELAIFEQPLSDYISDLNSFVATNQSNGFGWLVGSGLLQRIHTVHSQLASIGSSKNSVAKELAKLLAGRSQEEAEHVIAAGHAASRVLAAVTTLQEQSDAASASMATINEQAAGVQSAAETVSNLSGDLKAKAIASEESIAQIASAHLQVEELKRKADTRESDLEARVVKADESVLKTKNQADSAFEAVQKALRAVRDQGLAAAFQSRSDKLRGERRLWTLVFVGALAILCALATIFAIDLVDFTYEKLIVSLLRKLALAAPTIWLGWYSAKQVSRVALVQEDYEYKAATALAFQSYKEEAKLGADPELLAKLLNIAISTFGDNPVRLYSDSRAETVSPMEDLLKKMPPDKLTELLSSVLKLRTAT